MSSFKKLGDVVPEKYTGGIKVYLESPDDEYVIGRKWFSRYRDKISFEPVSEMKTDGGCNQVLKKVKESTDDSYGIVDRDILLADDKWRNNLWKEIDDIAFFKASPYGENVFVLHRWELENYLLQPEPLKQLVNDKEMSQKYTTTKLAEKLIEKENDFIVVTALSTITAQTPDKQASPRFGQNEGDELKKEVISHLSCEVAELTKHSDEIIDFAESESDAVKRWNKLSRMLDGKRVMHRLGRQIFKSLKINFESERGVLAGHIASNNLVDSHLENWLLNTVIVK